MVGRETHGVSNPCPAGARLGLPLSDIRTMSKSTLAIIGSLAVVAIALVLAGRMMGDKKDAAPSGTTDIASSADKATPEGQGAAMPGKAPGDTAGEVRVGLVFDVGGLGDKSFNDAAYRGLKKAEEELGIKARYIEPGDGSDRESALRQLASEGYSIIFGIGFIFSDDLVKLAQQYPNLKFAGIDFSMPQGLEKTPDNLVGLRFREHEGSFLVGAIAGLVTKTKKVGFVGGMEIPLIRKFEAGYKAGVKHVCADCEVLSGYAGTEPKAFNDPVKGQELAIVQYDRGADIIYHASGKTGDGVFNAAKERNKMVIGVDSDQFHVAPCCTLTSMLKKVDVAVYDTIRKAKEGQFQGGVFEFGLAEDGVGFVFDDNNKDRVTQEVADKVNALGKEIIAGTLKVPTE